MPRYKQLTSLDAIIRQCKIEGVESLDIEKIYFLDYRDTMQEDNPDQTRAETSYIATGIASIAIFYQQQYLTDEPDLFNAIDSAHEAKHFCQIKKGELREEDLQDIHNGYTKVHDLSEKELGTKIIKPSTLKWMMDYYGNESVAHKVEVEAVRSSLDVVKTMNYLDLDILNK